MRVFTDEEDEYLRELTLSDHTYREMARLHNERFPDHQITIKQCKCWRSRHHCFSKLTGRFEKGHVPANKGTHPPTVGRMAETQFKKGNVPYDYKPIGTISRRHDKNGHDYYWIKIKDPKTWQPLHVKIWTDANGPVPKGSIVTFCNGDTLDCRLDNLICITRSEHAVMNHMHCRGYDQDSAKVAVTLAHVHMSTNELKKKRKKKRK